MHLCGLRISGKIHQAFPLLLFASRPKAYAEDKKLSSLAKKASDVVSRGGKRACFLHLVPSCLSVVRIVPGRCMRCTLGAIWQETSSSQIHYRCWGRSNRGLRS